MSDALGLYVSIPFCRAKCTFCNFASDAFAATELPRYLNALCREVRFVRARGAMLDALVPEAADSIYLGGGTPSLLAPEQIRELFSALRETFSIASDAEITVECAPGQLSQASLDAFLHEGANRLSFGVQSFVESETRGAGRTHTAAECMAEIDRARALGLHNISVDLIAGLPGQTEESWRRSVDAVLASGVPHASVYMLEVDEDSRLGREVLAGGSRYGAAAVPGDDACVELYELACEQFEANGLAQYEISNFAREGRRSRHNVKYWTRAPYLGFGLDAHSMLPVGDLRATRFANTDDLGAYVAARQEMPGGSLQPVSGLPLLAEGSVPLTVRIGPREALEEALFLGLRMNEGIDVHALRLAFDGVAMLPVLRAIDTAIEDSLLERVSPDASRVAAEIVRLTRRGRALANEVFERLLIPDEAAVWLPTTNLTKERALA